MRILMLGNCQISPMAKFMYYANRNIEIYSKRETDNQEEILQIADNAIV